MERDQIAAGRLELVAFRGVDAENRSLLQAALGSCRSRNLDFVDVLVAATPRGRAWRVFTFDRDLERLAR